MPAPSPACAPYLFYDDVAEAMRFLTGAFGFLELRVDRGESGRVEHAQLGFGEAVVMLGGTGTYAGYRPRKNPVALGGLNAGVYLFVPDVDAHARHAEGAGAKIVMAAADMPWGDRLYCGEDPEGHFWMFATRIERSGTAES